MEVKGVIHTSPKMKEDKTNTHINDHDFIHLAIQQRTGLNYFSLIMKSSQVYSGDIKLSNIEVQ